MQRQAHLRVKNGWLSDFWAELKIDLQKLNLASASAFLPTTLSGNGTAKNSFWMTSTTLERFRSSNEPEVALLWGLPSRRRRSCWRSRCWRMNFRCRVLHWLADCLPWRCGSAENEDKPTSVTSSLLVNQNKTQGKSGKAAAKWNNLSLHQSEWLSNLSLPRAVVVV